VGKSDYLENADAAMPIGMITSTHIQFMDESDDVDAGAAAAGTEGVVTP
jgi:hypothetical protein